MGILKLILILLIIVLMIAGAVVILFISELKKIGYFELIFKQEKEKKREENEKR